MAPSTAARNPAGSPGAYQPAFCPTKLARKAPPMPRSVVMIKPPGSRPGIRNFATIPTTRPMSRVTTIDME